MKRQASTQALVNKIAKGLAEYDANTVFSVSYSCLTITVSWNDGPTFRSVARKLNQYLTAFGGVDSGPWHYEVKNINLDRNYSDEAKQMAWFQVADLQGYMDREKGEMALRILQNSDWDRGYWYHEKYAPGKGLPWPSCYQAARQAYYTR